MTRAYCGGVWDLFHYGHLRLLQRTRELLGPDGILIVGVISDAGAKRPPVIPFDQRLAIVSAIKGVTAVVEQPTHDSTEILKALPELPDFLVHGDDAEPLAAKWFEAQGGTVVLFPYTEGVSSSWLRMILATSGTQN